MKIKYLKTIILAVCLGPGISSCEKIDEVDLPVDKNTAGAVFENPSTAILAMTGVYGAMGNGLKVN